MEGPVGDGFRAAARLPLLPSERRPVLPRRRLRGSLQPATHTPTSDRIRRYALFSSLTVLENIQVPMREYLDLSPGLMEELARLKIDLVGLAPDAADKFPSELSGGMIKRAALARALALDPDIVFLDEPTSGLDPIGAADFDQLIMTLRDTLGLTVYMVTHDLDSLFQACDRIAVLGERKVLVEGPLSMMLEFDHPWVHSYFRGKRARTIVQPTQTANAPVGAA